MRPKIQISAKSGNPDILIVPLTLMGYQKVGKSAKSMPGACACDTLFVMTTSDICLQTNLAFSAPVPPG